MSRFIFANDREVLSYTKFKPLGRVPICKKQLSLFYASGLETSEFMNRKQFGMSFPMLGFK